MLQDRGIVWAVAVHEPSSTSLLAAKYLGWNHSDPDPLLPFDSELCWDCTPDGPHQHMSAFVLNSSKQSGTLQIVSVHWQTHKVPFTHQPA